MHDKIKEFLDAKKAEERKEYAEKKQKLLIELGLYEKVYTDATEYSNDFPYYEYDSENGVYKWYKREAVDVSDEEYAEILKYSGKQADIKDANRMNVVAIALNVIGWLTYIFGFISGIAFGTVEVTRGVYYTYTDTEFSFKIALIYWCASFISGTMFLGFAKIIDLLDDIKNK